MRNKQAYRTRKSTASPSHSKPLPQQASPTTSLSHSKHEAHIQEHPMHLQQALGRPSFAGASIVELPSFYHLLYREMTPIKHSNRNSERDAQNEECSNSTMTRQDTKTLQWLGTRSPRSSESGAKCLWALSRKIKPTSGCRSDTS